MAEIGYGEKENITHLVLIDNKGNAIYTYNAAGKAKKQEPEPTDRTSKVRALIEILKREGIDEAFVARSCKRNSLADITDAQYQYVTGNIPQIKQAYEAYRNGTQG